LTGAAVGAAIALSWNGVTGATSYWLEVGSGPGLSNLYSGDVGATTALTVPAPVGTYFVRVRARTPSGLGGSSNEVIVSVGVCATTPAPIGLAASVVGSLVTLQWNSPPGAVSFVLEAGLTTGASNVFNGNVGGTNTVAAVAPPGTYYVRVRAVSACGISTPSQEITVVVPR
jgi:hypothetical protein